MPLQVWVPDMLTATFAAEARLFDQLRHRFLAGKGQA
jgi:hypothetical protein